MRIFLYDTETTGLPASGHDELSILQPWMVQLGCVVLEDFEVVDGLNILVRPPDGADWQPKAIETHGITPKLVDAEGHDPVLALMAMRSLARGADMVAAYNSPFDERIVRTTAMRTSPETFLDDPIFPVDAQQVCVMQQAAAFLHGRAKLSQAYRILVGKPLEDAHDAYADCLATAEVLKAIIVKTLS
jgi:DNA polymerase III epsilon subunit-like protein